MPLIGLIGYPLGHTFSPAYFKEKFKALGLNNWDYQAFPLERISDLPHLIESHSDMVAFNITIPYKSLVLPYCHSISNAVDIIGASNLVCIDRKGQDIKLNAFNTDVIGFKQSLVNFIDDFNGKAVVFGTGGSSKAIAYVLKELNIDFDVVGRQSEINYYNLDVTKYQLFINCTPIGMSSNSKTNDVLPIDFSQIPNMAYFYDLIYNPEVTATMKAFEKSNAKVKNGLEMLHLQADAAWDIIQQHLFDNLNNAV